MENLETTIDAKTIISRNEKLTFTDIDDELILLSPTLGRVFSLNKTARATWLLLDKPITFGQICAQLTEVFDVDEEECRTELARLIRELASMKLLSLAPPC
ncbi:PqqD family protein [Oleisolibacter albus]|uniref:PqqD family protein n=1 Tax=Oleisolibacter albus TaxID=2171757 RepID=UPI00138FF645|nr:PqqD family protein [Oleisolibacter albus]